MVAAIIYIALPLVKNAGLPRISIPTAKNEMRLFANEALKKLRKYPPRPSKSRYKRTFKLRKGWKKEVSLGNNVGVLIFNEVTDKYGISYSGYVQGRRFTGDPRQLKRFKAQGWTSLTDVNQDIWPKYAGRIARALGVRRYRVRNIRL